MIMNNIQVKRNLIRASRLHHYNDAIMSAVASQIASLMIVYSTVYSDADQRKHQSSASLAFVMGVHRWPVNFPHKWPVTQKMVPFYDVINICESQKIDSVILVGTNKSTTKYMIYTIFTRALCIVLLQFYHQLLVIHIMLSMFLRLFRVASLQWVGQ